jgi:hypothetical protein
VKKQNNEKPVNGGLTGYKEMLVGVYLTGVSKKDI